MLKVPQIPAEARDLVFVALSFLLLISLSVTMGTDMGSSEIIRAKHVVLVEIVLIVYFFPCILRKISCWCDENSVFVPKIPRCTNKGG